MKRIAITHEEFLSEGVPAALHVNARTDRDWMRWTGYIRQHEEVTHVAFEFATGTGWADRIAWQAQHLARLAAEVERPLHLILRAGVAVLPQLRSAFTAVTFIDTSTFLKTVKRQRATWTRANRIAWKPSPTPADAPLDALLTANWQAIETALGHAAPAYGRIGAG